MAVGTANKWLRRLGYEPEDASVTGAPDERLALSGQLVNHTVEEADDMDLILRMLPAKVDLLAFRVVLRADEPQL